MDKWSLRILRTLLIILLLAGCNDKNKTDENQNSDGKAEFNIDFEQYQLDNGLNVILHTDRSDPVVAVALTSHVGSAREVAGRTGFAHLFEHLLFLESENLGKGGLDKMSARIGGSGANGSTSRDRTNYFQTVPKDALEKMLWAEADKLGFFINTVTEPVLAKEKQVVKNEKRQSVDNVPYGHANYVIGKNLYPEGHPYNWQVIGSLEDLQNATLEDVKEFYRKWYVPNNVTLTVAGDFDKKQAKEWIEKYFSEIKRGGDIEPLEKQPVDLEETRLLYHEDILARLPELRMVWPTVYQYHPDSYALRILATYLSDGKEAPLNEILIDEQKLTSGVTMMQRGSEIAGEMNLIVRANPGQDLDAVRAAIETGFDRFEKEGISEEALQRIKSQQETAFYNGLSSVLGKGFQLAQYQIFANDPGFINQDIRNILEVSAEDVKMVFEKYIAGKPFVSTSFVPKGMVSLALEGAKKAEVVEEQIIKGAEAEVDLSGMEANYDKTPSTFDRTKEPPYGEPIIINPPKIWKSTLNNKLVIHGIVDTEVPLVQFVMEIGGGQLLDNPAKPGVANLTALLMNKGTKKRTVENLENELAKLGASLRVTAQPDGIVIRGNTLSRNYEKTMQLLTEILLEPRWDEEEFNLAKQNVSNRLRQQNSRPDAIAAREYDKLLYGEDHIYSRNILGTEESLAEITLEDLRNFHQTALSPHLTKFNVVGNVKQEQVMKSMNTLEAAWKEIAVEIPDYPTKEGLSSAKIYFYDVPEAKQSVLRFGYLALPATHEDYYPATVMNYRLGGGGFASILTQVLREGKGYTYGIRSGFSGREETGTFTISSGVRSNVTYEATRLIRAILDDYQKDFDEKDLSVTKDYMLKSSARSSETPGAKLRMLQNISNYGWEDDYLVERQEFVKQLTLDDVKELIGKYIRPDNVYFLIVGDAETQLENLTELGLGKPILLN